MTSDTRQYLDDAKRQPQPSGFITCRADLADLFDGIANLVKRTSWQDLETSDAERLETLGKRIRQKIKDRDTGLTK